VKPNELAGIKKQSLISLNPKRVSLVAMKQELPLAFKRMKLMVGFHGSVCGGLCQTRMRP